MERKTKERASLLLSVGIWFLILVIIFGVIRWSPMNNSVVPNDTSIYINQIDSLQKEIDSITTLKNSVDQKIDTIKIKIIETKVKYEKDRSTILNNTTGEDYEFFINYIGTNRARLDSINYF